MYLSPNIVNVIKSRRWQVMFHVVIMEEGRSAFKFLIATPAGKRHLGRRRWEDNIRMHLKEIGINMRNLIDSA